MIAEMDRLKELREMPSVVWSGEAFDCGICLDEIGRGTRVRQLYCKHAYHTGCIDEWLREAQMGMTRRCPLCNANPLAKGDTLNPWRALPAGVMFSTDNTVHVGEVAYHLAATDAAHGDLTASLTASLASAALLNC